MNFVHLKQQYLKQTEEAKVKRNEIELLTNKKEELVDKKLKQIDKLKSQIDKLQRNKYTAAGYPSWIDSFVEPIAKHFAEEFDMGYEIYGPFGLRAQVSIYWQKAEHKNVSGKPMKSLVLIPTNLEEAELGYETGFQKDGITPADYSSNDPNGFRREVKPLPTTLEGIRACIRHYAGTEE